MFSRFTQRARNVLAAAGRIATPPSDPAIGAAHLGAAELAEPEGIAGRVIAKAGLTAEQVYSSLGAGPVTPGPDATAATLSELAFDESGKAVLKAALKAALRLGHNYIGTEHLLLGVLQAGGPAAEAFASLGLTLQTAQQLMADEFEQFQTRRMTG